MLNSFRIQICFPSTVTFIINNIYNNIFNYLYFSSDKCIYVILIFKDWKSLQQILFKPFPVFSDFFSRATCMYVKKPQNNNQKSQNK